MWHLPRSSSALLCWVPWLWKAQGCHCCPQGHAILGTVLASLSCWPTAVPGVPPCPNARARCRAGVFLPLGTSWCQSPAKGCQCSPPRGTAQGPTITLLCPQGSHRCPPRCPMSRRRSRAWGKEGYLQPPAVASKVFSTGSGPCLPAGNGCAVPCGLTPSTPAHRPSHYLVPKVPSRHQSPAEPITTSWAPPQPGTASGFGAFLTDAWPRPAGTQQWKCRHPWAGLTGTRVQGEAGGQGKAGQALGSPRCPGWWDGADVWHKW